jgi:cyclic beta-1,2-glucan synthetase
MTAYAEWVLGSSRSASAPYIVTGVDSKTGAIFARNAWEGEFGGRIAFADLGGKQVFGHRRPNKNLSAAMERSTTRPRWSAASGFPEKWERARSLRRPANFRRVAPRRRAEIVFFLGQAENREQARRNHWPISRRQPGCEILSKLRANGTDLLGTVQVTTPEPAMDILLNRWLLYQTLSCRVWGRAAFYQFSGAYGFRDQLQDGWRCASPTGTSRASNLLRAASRQFVEGDVQHWWHPPSGRGVRTRISDDLALAALRGEPLH